MKQQGISNATLAGRYKKTPAEFDKYAELWRQGKITVGQACAEMGICRTTWYARMKEIA